MPANVVHSKKDEKDWTAAKLAAAHRKGKSVSDLSGDDWRLVMGIYKKINKNEDFPDFIKTEVKESLKKGIKIPKIKAPKSPGALMADPMKVGTQATVKMPKAKKPADPFESRPSRFWKSESVKGIHKLRDFKDHISKKKI